MWALIGLLDVYLRRHKAPQKHSVIIITTVANSYSTPCGLQEIKSIPFKIFSVG